MHENHIVELSRFAFFRSLWRMRYVIDLYPYLLRRSNSSLFSILLNIFIEQCSLDKRETALVYKHYLPKLPERASLKDISANLYE